MAITRCKTELGRPHLVLSNIGRDNRIAFGQMIQAVKDMLRSKSSFSWVSERILEPPRRTLFKPLFGVAPFH